MSGSERLLLSSTLAALACVTAAASALAIDPPRNRHEFARAISELKEVTPEGRFRGLKEGTPEAEVLDRLGRPDDIRTEHDPGGISTVGTKEIWRYGTSGHLTTATLGQVYIGKDGRSQYVFGKGTPPPEGMFEERNLRVLLDALGEVPSYNAAWDYNPRKVIRAVNLLHPLGKEKALAAIDEYLRVSSHWHDDGREGVFLVLRTLFDVPEDLGHMPPMLVGAPSPSEPEDPKLLPRFPIAIEGDIPFLVAEGFNLAGSPEPPESHVAYFREKGRLRPKPLAPSAVPFQELDRFARSPRWTFKKTAGLFDDERGRQFLGTQVLRLIDTVYRVEPGLHGDLLPFGRKEEARRKKIVEEASSTKLRWDAAAQKYTFLDGTSLPEPEVKHYRREIWRPKADGLDVELILERDGPRSISVWVVESYEVGKPGPAAAFTVFDVSAKDKALAEFKAGGRRREFDADVPVEALGGKTGTSSTWKPCELKEGAEVQVKLVVRGESRLSPIFKP
jgi:hypothetical protein